MVRNETKIHARPCRLNATGVGKINMQIDLYVCIFSARKGINGWWKEYLCCFAKSITLTPLLFNNERRFLYLTTKEDYTMANVYTLL